MRLFVLQEVATASGFVVRELPSSGRRRIRDAGAKEILGMGCAPARCQVRGQGQPLAGAGLDPGFSFLPG